jgi:hypothetical protein
MGTTSVVPQKLRKTQGFSPCGMLCAGRAAFMQPVLGGGSQSGIFLLKTPPREWSDLIFLGFPMPIAMSSIRILAAFSER